LDKKGAEDISLKKYLARNISGGNETLAQCSFHHYNKTSVNPNITTAKNFFAFVYQRKA